MSVDWSLAWQVGVVGFGLVFVILIVLFLVLSFTGWLSTKVSPVKPKAAAKTGVPAAIK